MPLRFHSLAMAMIQLRHTLKMARIRPNQKALQIALFVSDVGNNEISNGSISLHPLIPSAKSLSDFAALPERKTWWQDSRFPPFALQPNISATRPCISYPILPPSFPLGKRCHLANLSISFARSGLPIPINGISSTL